MAKKLASESRELDLTAKSAHASTVKTGQKIKLKPGAGKIRTPEEQEHCLRHGPDALESVEPEKMTVGQFFDLLEKKKKKRGPTNVLNKDPATDPTIRQVNPELVDPAQQAAQNAAAGPQTAPQQGAQLDPTQIAQQAAVGGPAALPDTAQLDPEMKQLVAQAIAAQLTQGQGPAPVGAGGEAPPPQDQEGQGQAQVAPQQGGEQPPQQEPSAPGQPGQDQGQPGMEQPGQEGQPQLVGPEMVGELPPTMPIKYDQAGAPDKYTLDGHTVRWDGREYILSWEPEKYVYRLVDPMTMIVRLRVKPEQISVIQPDKSLASLSNESVADSIPGLAHGDSLADHLRLLLWDAPILVA
jgi:hypothetical protein